MTTVKTQTQYVHICVSCDIVSNWLHRVLTGRHTPTVVQWLANGRHKLSIDLQLASELRH